jgi:hypothetical protein
MSRTRHRETSHDSGPLHRSWVIRSAKDSRASIPNTTQRGQGRGKWQRIRGAAAARRGGNLRLLERLDDEEVLVGVRLRRNDDGSEAAVFSFSCEELDAQP